MPSLPAADGHGVKHSTFLEDLKLGIARVLGFWSLLLLFASPASAAYTIPWHTIEGGGRTSKGGVFEVSGTVGQADASSQPSTNNGWAVTGGFWPGLVMMPGGPLLTLYPLDAANVTVAWTTAAVGYKLQYSTDLKVWTDYPGLTISGAANIAWPLNTGPRYFFRLKKH